MYKSDLFGLFIDNWFMTVTMLMASFIAGATSEGGAAIAFPVMTLFFKIQPSVSRDFSLMIQSFGMVMAAVSILIFKIKIMPKVIISAATGGFFGLILGFHFIDGILPAHYIKMFFTSFWLSFSAALYLSTKKSKKEKNDLTILTKKNHFTLFLVGVIGGAITSITGSGIDIIIFSVLTLSYKIPLKVATPTSVILMSATSLFGFIYKENLHVPMLQESWNYLFVCIPIVVIGAPIGALFISSKSRNFIQKLLSGSIIAQFIASLIIIPQNAQLLVFSALTFIIGSIFFYILSQKHKAN